MRDFKGMKRQRSRNRNGGGGGGGGGGKPQHNTNRAFDSNGPEGVKVRGAAQHVYEKYQQMARDAQTSGDRVLAENYLQHAEHYFRLMRAMQPQRPLSEIIGRDQFVSGYDIDFEDESFGNDGGDSEAETDGADQGDGGMERGQRYEGRRDDQPRQDRFQNDRTAFDRAQPERPYAERAAAERSAVDRQSRDDRGARQTREDRPRFNRDERPSRADRSERDLVGMVEPETAPPAPPAESMNNGPVLRADDGQISHAPAFLQVRASEGRGESGEEVRRPRRRRTPASFGPADGASPKEGADET